MPSPFVGEWQLQDYLHAVRLHWRLLVLTIALFAVPTAIHMQQQPNVYRAAARVRVESETPKVVEFGGLAPSAGWMYKTFLATEVEIVTSPAVMKTVVEELNLAAFPPFSRAEDPASLLRGMVRVEEVPDTKLIDIVVAGTKPELTARIANGVADAYVRQNLQRRQQATAGGIQWLQEEVLKMEDKVRSARLERQAFVEQHSTMDFGTDRQNALLQRIQALNAAINQTREQRIEAETKYREKHPALLELYAKEKELHLALFEQEQQALEMNRLAIQYDTLERDVKTSEAIYNALLTRLKELSVQEGLQTNNLQVVDYAKTPRRPIGPNRMGTVNFAAILGFLVGGAGAILLESFNQTIRNRKQFEHVLEIPFLGQIQEYRVPGQRQRREMPLLSRLDSQEAVGEGIRSIRTTLEFLLSPTPSHVLLVTSALPEEGKSSFVTNLAISLRELDRKVILIEGDMRRPFLHRYLSMALEPGLSGYLQGQTGIEEMIQLSKEGKDLPVISAGITPDQPADLLHSPRMRELIERLKKEYQYVLIDTPPVLVVADTAALVSVADGALYVVRAGQTHQDVALAGKNRLVDVGAKIIGGVLNQTRPEMERGYSYYYYYRYGKGRGPATTTQASPATPA